MFITYKTTTNYRTVSNDLDDLFGLTNNTMPYTEGVIRTKTFTKRLSEFNPNKYPEVFRKLSSFNRTLQGIFDACPEPRKMYTSFKIPKKTHGFRDIDAPNSQLKVAMQAVVRAFNNLNILPHDAAWAYVKGRDVVGALTEHKKNDSRWFLKLDLHNFFGSCTPEFIESKLNNLYPFALDSKKIYLGDTIKKLSKWATLRNGLPQGTPLSPMLTNLLMVEYDYKITAALGRLAKEGSIYKQRYVYTRYADDILISAKYKFDYNKIVEVISNLLHNTPLVLNKEKTRFGSCAGRNWNLGIMYNKDNNITVGYKKKKMLKISIHKYFIESGTWSLNEVEWLLGQLSWLRNVEPDYFQQLLKYIKDKYDADIVQSLIADIKRLNS